MKNLTLCLFLTLVACIVTGAPSYANLMITPLQVIIEGRDRSAQVILINNGTEEKTYRLEWEELVQTGGTTGYIAAEYASQYGVTPPAIKLSDFGVFTPRQITLAPQEKQTVRIAVRRPPELADGEYRSHLRFEVVKDPNKKARIGEGPVEEGKLRFGATVNASFSIPVIYRVGPYDINIDMQTPTFNVNDKTGKLMIDVPVIRSGKNGVIGLIEAYHTPNGGTETFIGSISNTNIFPEITMRQFKVPTQVAGLSPGTLRLVFKKAEGQTSNYVVLDELTVPVSN